MIRAVAYQTIVEVELSGFTFYDDLARFKGEINQKDREWNPTKNRWIVRNPRNYQHLDYIKAALEERKRQLELF